ncbi:MAG: DUF4349 domain-containing protein [Clostridia bacterium]|nr:DUF4349 domain-containing protein [Clostridia bacterium]MDY6185214.1 DUF4349 domain-containing protein [Eubacteriales bacterium]
MKKVLVPLFALFLCLSCVLFSSCGKSETGDSAYPNEMAPGADSGGSSVSSPQISEDRKVIVTATYELETLTFDETCSKLEQATKDAGGYVKDSSVRPHTQSSKATAKYTLRIPASATDSFSTTLVGIGNVTYQTQSTQDVTLSYADVTARIASLEEEQTRVLQLYQNATTTSETLQIQNRLSDINAELSSLRSQLAVMENAVAYSTFTVSIRETKSYTEEESDNFWVQFGSSFGDSFGTFLDVLGNVMIALVYVLPYGLVGGAIVTAVILIHRHKKKTKGEKNPTPPTSPGGFGRPAPMTANASDAAPTTPPASPTSPFDAPPVTHDAPQTGEDGSTDSNKTE